MLDQAGVAPGSRVLDVAAADAERLASGTWRLRRGDLHGCGLLFLPDVATALSELRHGAAARRPRVGDRLLRARAQPGLLAVIRRRAAPRPRSFGLWRPGVLATALGAAGFVDVEVERVDAPLHLPSAADCVRFVRESFAALHALVAELDHAAQEEAWAAIEAELRAFEGAGGFRVPCQLLVAGGQANLNARRPAVLGSGAGVSERGQRAVRCRR